MRYIPLNCIVLQMLTNYYRMHPLKPGLLSLSTLSITTIQIKPALTAPELMKEWYVFDKNHISNIYINLWSEMQGNKNHIFCRLSIDGKEENPKEILLQNKLKSAEKVTITELIERPSNGFEVTLRNKCL